MLNLATRLWKDYKDYLNYDHPYEALDTSVGYITLAIVLFMVFILWTSLIWYGPDKNFFKIFLTALILVVPHLIMFLMWRGKRKS